MRILMVAPLLPRPDAPSGGALVIHGHLTTLLARHEVTLVTFAGPDPRDGAGIARLRELGVAVYPLWRVAPTGLARWYRRVRLAARWLAGRRPLRALEFAEPRVQHLLDRLLAARHFDLLHVEDNAMAGYRYRARLPAILTEYEVGLIPAGEARRDARGARRALREVEWRRWLRYERLIWPRFERIQVFTERDAAAIRAASPAIAAHVRVNPFGIDLPPERPCLREDDGSLAFVGGFAHPPNVDAALWLGQEIMPRLRTCGLRPHLVIVGDQPPAAVRALAGPDVIVTGRVPAIGPYLERAAIVLAPLRTGGGMRVKVLQAMAHGKAVVTTPAGCAGLAVGDDPPPLRVAEDAAGFAAAVAELLAAPATRTELGRRARAFVAAHHGWDGYARRLEAIHAELGAGGHG